MHRNMFWKGCIAAAMLAGAAQAGAGVITSMVGNANSFGLVSYDLEGNETPVTLADGSDFDSLGVANGVDDLGNLEAVGTRTDLLYAQVVQLTFSYALPAGAPTSAGLRLFTAGWGLYGAAKVFFNGNYVGDLSDGDGRSLNPLGMETAQFDSFGVDTAWLTGNDTLRIEVAQSLLGTGPDFIDLGAVDFAALDITTASTGGGDLPEPASLALAALGLIAAGAARRRAAR